MSSRTPSGAALALLALALLGAGCTGPASPPSGDDDDSVYDDDDASDDDDATPDDDDDDTEPPAITAVTFAASTEGLPQAWPDGGAVTDLSGTFQFLYWESLEEQVLRCRQRFTFTAAAQFGDAMAEPGGCADCGGILAVTSVQETDPAAHADSCPELPPDVDLGFLLLQDDVAVPSDFRSLALIPVETLLDADWQLSPGGLSAAQLVERYSAAGLEVHHLAFVQPSGWLDQDAGLDQVASPWGDGGPLPMFVAYADPNDWETAPTMEGPCFLAGIWTVRVGEGADALP